MISSWGLPFGECILCSVWMGMLCSFVASLLGVVWGLFVGGSFVVIAWVLC